MTADGYPRVGVERDADGFWRVTWCARPHHQVYMPQSFDRRDGARARAVRIARELGAVLVIDSNDTPKVSTT